MNNQQFKEFKSNIPDFEEKHCFLLDPESLVYDKNNSQIRKNGHIVAKFKEFAELIANGAALPPISVRALPNSRWELKEGCTRAGGAEKAKKPIFATDYMDRVLEFTEAEWEDWQAKGNDHENASPNTVSDIESFIDRQCKNGNLRKKLGFKYDGNEERFVGAAAKHYRHDIYRNCGKDLNFFRRKVKKALAGKVSGFYENYSKDQSFQFFATHTGFAGKEVGDISANQVAYTFSQTNHTSPAIIGHVASKLMDNPGVKVTIVYHVGDLVGKNDAKILKERKKIVEWFDKVKTHYGWFDELYFLPQIKQGENKENLYKLIKSRS